jgi:hypothetical protein
LKGRERPKLYHLTFLKAIVAVVQDPQAKIQFLK